MRPVRSRRRALVVLSLAPIAALLGLATASPAAAQHPNHPLGYEPTRPYQDLSEIDTVDLFSGTLGLQIQIGPFALVYNSNVWRYEIRDEPGGDRIHSFPDRERTAGHGWHLGLGEVYHASHSYNDSGRWLYVDDKGGHHVFYQTLHKGEDDGDAKVFYTRDGSYLRLEDQTTPPPGNCHWSVDIHHPDGSIRRFDSGTCGQQSTYRLSKAWGPVASEDDPTATTPEFTVSYGVDPADPEATPDTLRTVTDRFGRSHRIHLTAEFGYINRVVTQVDVQGVGTDRYLYHFTYDDIPVNRSCKHTSGEIGPRLPLPHLIRLDLPDGTSYSMKEPGERFYYNLCHNNLGDPIDDVPGVLYGIDLPTGGKIRWEFQENEYPPGEGASVFSTTAGVGSRTLLEPGGAELAGAATWTYKVASSYPAGGDPEVHTEVVHPTGDCTKHHFDARTTVDPGQWLGWEYGLPFVYSEESGGKYLSSQVWTSSGANGSCSGELLRSTYLRFRHDVPPASDCSGAGDFCSPVDWYNLNRQVAASRTVYHDDGGVWSDAELWEFDGIGHHRREVLTGNFWSGSTTAERRETFVNFNRASGVYFAPGYVPPAPSEPWVLGVYDHVEVTESDAAGETTQRTELGFESETGFLSCTRVLASGTSRSPQDVVTFRTRNDLNQVIDSKLYGGDLQVLSVAEEGCGALPAEPVYWVRNAYDYGVLASTRPMTPSGGSGPFLTYDVDVDPSSGWVTSQRDSAGYEVTYGYDGSGRLDTVQPADGAEVRLTYYNATGGPAPQSPRLVFSQWTADGKTRLSETETVFDAFGRPTLERRLLPGGIYAEQETVRNARGWIVSESEWGDLTKVTQRLEFDPFGRPGRIRPPSTATYDVKLAYWGDRKTRREVRIRYWDPDTGTDGLAYVPHTEEYDRHGRLRKVTERSEPGGGLIDTSYAYDVGNRLTAISSGTGTPQLRGFEYDNRGFMLSETHPEKGLTGNGTVSYQDFDALGLPHRKIDGPHDLDFLYDFMGRLTEARDNNQADRTVSRYAYDLAPGWGLGKPWRIDRVNWVELPGSATGVQGVEVSQIFRYQGRRGAVSRKETQFSGWDLGTFDFAQDYAYDELGNVDAITYPRCLTTGCGGWAAQEREVSYAYENGLLTAVPGWADSITYHPSGQWSQIQHANGVADVLTANPYLTRRIERLETSGVMPAGSAGFDTGILRYDGADNLRKMGPAVFAYDKAQRLVRADYGGGLLREYGYDQFGNLTQLVRDGIETITFGVDPGTNRLSGGAYDGAGNLVSWAGAAFTYDTANQLVAQADEVYLYDALGERAATLYTPRVWGELEPLATFHLRDPANRVLSRIHYTPEGVGFEPSAGGWSRDRDYVYGARRLLALERFGPSGPETRHYHLDHLGSPRLITRADATVHASHTFMPYGEDLIPGGDDDATRFGGHERDRAAGTDYLHARHYSPGLGRFLSVDPELGDVSLPQRLNRYAYVMGNPLSLTDPTGRDPEDNSPNTDQTSTGDEVDMATFGEVITVWASYDRPNYYTYTFFPGRFGPSSPGGGNPTAVARPERGLNPPERDENGELDCSGQAFSVLCEVPNDNSDEPNSLDCGLLAFGAVSVAGGATLAGAQGLYFGLQSPAVGYASTIETVGGMGGLANWTYGGTQIPFFAGAVARGSVGAWPLLLPGGAITSQEIFFLGLGGMLGPVLPALGDLASGLIDRAWNATGCGDQ